MTLEGDGSSRVFQEQRRFLEQPQVSVCVGSRPHSHTVFLENAFLGGNTHTHTTRRRRRLVWFTDCHDGQAKVDA